MRMKRLFDLVCVIPGIIVLAPLFLLIAVWVKLESPGPVFFRQERVGLNGRLFRILKFRTMVANAESLGGQLTVGADRRVTKAGHLLRRYKLDELPQLFNVLLGDMSLVGPRPEVPRYVALYTDEQRQVLRLRPGITDPASIEFRAEAELLGTADDPERYYIDVLMPEKIRLNMEYSKRATLWQDILTIFRTLGVIGK